LGARPDRSDRPPHVFPKVCEGLRGEPLGLCADIDLSPGFAAELFRSWSARRIP
jgi:hypothetical protein